MMKEKYMNALIYIGFLIAFGITTYTSKISLTSLMDTYGIETILWISAVLFTIEIFIAIVIIIGILSTRR